MGIQSEAIRIRLTEEESQAFEAVVARYKETKSGLIRKYIRELINGYPDLLLPEMYLFKNTYDLLDEILEALPINAHTETHDKLHKTIEKTQNLLEEIIHKTEHRWVKNG